MQFAISVDTPAIMYLLKVNNGNIITMCERSFFLVCIFLYSDWKLNLRIQRKFGVNLRIQSK